MNRREFVARAAAMGAALALGRGCARPLTAPRWREQRDAFPQGVAPTAA